MMMQWIRIGDRIFAREHVAGVTRADQGNTTLLRFADGLCWTFEGDEADTVWRLARSMSLDCSQPRPGLQLAREVHDVT